MVSSSSTANMSPRAPSEVNAASDSGTSSNPSTPAKPSTPATQPSIPQINIPSAESSPFKEVNTSTPQPSVHTSNSNERTIGENYPRLPIASIPILYKEAMLDTPSFRAHCEYMDKQMREIGEWFQALISRNKDIDAKLRPLRYAVNHLLEIFMPSFIYNNVLDQSNLSVVFEHYAEGVSIHWTSVMYEARKHFAHIANAYKTYRQGQLSHYNTAREKWLQQQSLFDKATVEYYSLGEKTTPEVLRDAAQQLYNFRLRYLKQSLLYCETVVECQRKLNDIITDSLTRPFKADVPSFIPREKRAEIGQIMGRMSAYTRSQVTSSAGQAAILKLRSDLLEDAKKKMPSRMSTDYERAPDMWFDQPEQFCRESDVSEKYGWLMLKIPQGSRNSRALWVRVWVFVKDGTMGWLSLSQNKTFVQESPFVAVPLCYVHNGRNEGRNFCFKITTPRITFTLQTSSCADLKSWLSVIQAAREQFLGLNPSKFISASSWTDNISCRYANKILEIKGVSLPGTDIGTTQAISKRVDSCIETISGSFSFMDASKPFNNNHFQLAPDLLQTKPMATHRTLEAVVTSSFFPHRAVPNAIIGNYAGSVNWGLYSEALSKINPVDGSDPLNIGGNRSEYPAHYPETLRFHDMDMRSYFGPNMQYKTDEDLVVMVVRATLQARNGQYSPSTLYITGRTMFAISYANGFYGLLSIPLADFLVVECSIVEEYDSVKLTYRCDTNYQDINLRFYIDPGTLFQRRLQFLFDNCKAPNPFKLERIVATLENIGREHYNDTPRLANWGGENTAAPKELPSSIVPDQFNLGLGAAAGHDLTSPGNLKLREEHKDTQLEHHQAENLKLVQDVSFDISPKQLFYLIFGDKSSILSDVVTNSNDLKWYYNNSAVEREYTVDLSKLIWFGYSDSRGIDVLQWLERRDENYFYSVSEISGACNLHTARFQLKTKYVVALSKKSTRLLIYASIEWLDENTNIAQMVLDNIVEETCKRRPEILIEKIQRHIRALPRKPDSPHLYDLSNYGKVRITAARTKRSPREFLAEKSGASVGFLRFMLWNYSLTMLVRGLRSFKSCVEDVFQIVSANALILLVAGVSILINIYLISYNGVEMWHNYFMVRSTERYLDALHISPEPSIASHRAIFSKDVEQLVRQVRNFSDIADEDNTCWQSFQRLALQNPYDHPDQFGYLGLDKRSQKLVENTLQKRLDFAMRRNKLLSEFYMLENSELEFIRLEWKRWVLNEVRNCAEARKHAALTEKAGIEVALIDYCVPCIQAASLLL